VTANLISRAAETEAAANRKRAIDRAADWPPTIAQIHTHGATTLTVVEWRKKHS
jgi:hypothetical protein